MISMSLTPWKVRDIECACPTIKLWYDGQASLCSLLTLVQNMPCLRSNNPINLEGGIPELKIDDRISRQRSKDPVHSERRVKVIWRVHEPAGIVEISVELVECPL